MNNHTLGPWKVVPALSSPGRFCVITESDGISITGWGSVTQADSDAKLIAAAPDLLEACESYIRAMEQYGHPDKSDRLMLAAIKKATE